MKRSGLAHASMRFDDLHNVRLLQPINPNALKCQLTKIAKERRITKSNRRNPYSESAWTSFGYGAKKWFPEAQRFMRTSCLKLVNEDCYMSILEKASA